MPMASTSTDRVLRLGQLMALLDDHGISIDGAAVSAALDEARAPGGDPSTGPSPVLCRTTIGAGEPLGLDEVTAAHSSAAAVAEPVAG